MKPKGSQALTYYASKYMVYRWYLSDAVVAGFRPLRAEQFDEILLDAFPSLRVSKLRGVEILDGARFYRDKVGGQLAYGV
ncbi:MAG: hypothetical protein HC841_00105 [Verrucomicrobiae bacterium]|nr:hypothetical protein [Verrucomicrobiae bacterium]